MTFPHMFRRTSGPLALLFSLGIFGAGGASPAQAQQQMEQITLTGIRDMRYCEFLLIYEDRVDIYNTSASDGCPAELWQSMDVAELAKTHGATRAQLNGPKFWAPDEQTIEFGGAKDFGGIEARYGATLPLSALGASEGSAPYTRFTSSKKQAFVFKAGLPVYELVDPDGNSYVLNAYGAQVRDGDPANLAEQLSPAEGWSFRVSTPSRDLIVEAATDADPVQMVGDDMHQYYTLLEPAAK